jgi:ABC-type nitrate/sulfonate/bicarbonate transport system substrate-binding protein
MNVGRFKTKRGLGASLFILGVVSIFLADLAESQERKKIVVAYVAASEQMIIPTLAQETGIFRKHGLDAQVVLVSGSPRNVQSLIAGNFDYTMAGVTPLVRAKLSGADPVILAAIANYSSQKRSSLRHR